MHFNIYLEDETGLRLMEAAQHTGESRNALIRRAVQEWLARCDKPQWPEAVLNFTGMSDMPAFEAGREHLAVVTDDPLA